MNLTLAQELCCTDYADIPLDEMLKMYASDEPQTISSTDEIELVYRTIGRLKKLEHFIQSFDRNNPAMTLESVEIKVGTSRFSVTGGTVYRSALEERYRCVMAITRYGITELC